MSAKDAAVQRFVNLELREKTANGDYLFVDNHYVYNAPLYVNYGEDGKLELIEYSRANMDECCLAFDMAITSRVESTCHTACFLNSESSDVTFDITYHNGYQNATQERQVAMRKKQQAEWLEIRRQMTDDPEQCMELLLKCRDMKYTEVGELIERNSKTIIRIVKSKTNPNLNTAVLICFGMNIPPVISNKLLDVLDCKLKPMNPEHQWISEALHVKYPEPLWVVRGYLRQYDVEL